MAKGDYDQVVPATTRDELGELAVAFNTMARRIREFQQAGTARLVPAQQTAQATIDSFPDPVVVVDLDGAVERANPAACRLLHVTSTNGSIPWAAPPLLKPALTEVLGGRPDHLPTNLDHALCLRDSGQEQFYLPRVLAIRGDDGLLGAAVVLQDVTKFRLVDQLKSDMVSTVSHELKTPLTSVQMAVHLLLEEAVGPLDAQAGRAAAGGAARFGAAAGDGQRPARPDADRAGARPPRPAARSRRPTWSARLSTGSRRARAMPASSSRPPSPSACRRCGSIASGSATSSTT